MEWLKNLFGASTSKPEAGFTTRRVSVRDPLIIPSPKLGYLNLVGPVADPLVDEDIAALKQYFSDVVRSDADIPICDVLLLYAKIDADGAIENSSESLREIVYRSHAPIVIVATNNSGQSYIAASKRPGLGKANLVMTLDRKGASFTKFFAELFGLMRAGITMPMAWVKLAPQGPGHLHENIPGAICAMEVTHVVFK